MKRAKKCILWAFLVVLLLLALLYLGFRATVYRDMLALNKALNIPAEPGFFAAPVLFYREEFDRKLQVGMPIDEVERMLSAADHLREPYLAGGGSHWRIYVFRIASTPGMKENYVHLHVYLDDDGRVVQWGVDNS